MLRGPHPRLGECELAVEIVKRDQSARRSLGGRGGGHLSRTAKDAVRVWVWVMVRVRVDGLSTRVGYVTRLVRAVGQMTRRS